MNLFSKLLKNGNRSSPLAGEHQSSRFAPETVLRDWHDGDCFRINDAVCGTAILGSTGSGKTTGIGRHIGMGYLAGGFGILVLCAKSGEREMWQKWAKEAGREDDVIVFDDSAKFRYNFLDCEAERRDAGGGLSINVVSILDELANAVANAGKSQGGDSQFWKDSTHQLLVNLMELPMFAGLRVSLPLMRSILNSAPLTLEQASDPGWKESSICYGMIREADKRTMDLGEDVRADFEECRDFWLLDFPALSDRTRSIITLSFATLIRPLITRPLRELFCSTTNVRPEDLFDGKIIIVDLPIQSFRVAGRIANLAWKYTTQLAIMRRKPPVNGYLRPVAIWADEAQNFITEFDAEFQAVARSSGGATVYITQNRESYLRVLGNHEAVDAFLGNLVNKFFCQNCGPTNDWAAQLLGQHWVATTSTSFGKSRPDVSWSKQEPTQNSGVSRSDQRRYLVEPSTFTTLKRGSALYGYEVECIAYKGGHLFTNNFNGQQVALPYKFLTLKQG